ncbi:MAG: DUF6259 domain-containing protein [Armatimonadota bacterium]
MINMQRPAILMLLCLAAISTIPCQAAIRSSRLEVDLQNGTAVSVKNMLTGEAYTSPKSNVYLAGLYAVDGKTKMASDMKDAVSKSDAESITQTASWDGGSSSWSSSYAFDASGDLVINQSGKSAAKGVYGISWGIDGIPDSLTVLIPGDSGQRFSADSPAGIRAFDYPFQWESPFTVIQGKQGGVIVYAEDPAFQFKSIFIEHIDGSFRLRFESRNQAPFDDLTSIKSVKWRMKAYKGPWQTGAEIYRKWMVSQIKPIPMTKKHPAWAKDIQFMSIVGMEKPILTELAKHVNPKQTLLYVPDWRRDGYDRNYPDYTAVPQFAGFVDAAHKLGFKVMAHVNYFGCDPRHPLYAQLSKYHIKDPFTKEPQWWWPPIDLTIKIAYINPASKLWRKIFVSRMKELVARYKVDALHIDQTLVMFNDANGLIDGMNCIEGNIQLHKELYAALPQVAISGEGLDEVTCIYETFAQRHVMGIDLWNGTWNNQRLAQAHPISAYIVSPYTTMIGYLGMPNPIDNPGLYTAWRKAYEHYNVIPSYPRPRIDDLRKPTALSASILNDARFFQKYQPIADFTPPWKPNDIFRYKMNDGRTAFYRKDNGVILGTEDKSGKTEVLSRRISGVGGIAVGGSISDWLAYNERKIIGLNPELDYIWSGKPRDNNAVHISDISSNDFVLSQAGVHGEFMRFRLDSRLNTIGLWNFGGPASCGVTLTAGGEKKYSGTNFTDASGGHIQTEGDGLFMHPPWQSTGKLPDGSDKAASVGRTFVEYTLTFPAAEKIIFSAGAALKKDAIGKSDGITVIATASAGIDSISDSVHNDRAEPVMLSIDLTRYAGKQVTLRLELDPGPAGSATYDWGMVSHPVIEMEYHQPGSVDIKSKNPLTGALTAFGDANADKVDDSTYKLNLTLPNTITVPFTQPVSASLPYSLLSAPRMVNSLSYDGKEGPPAGYASAGVDESACLKDKRPSLAQHPPGYGKTLVDYWITLPAKPARLVTAIGLRDESKSEGVGFEVWVNGKSLYSKAIIPNTGWLPVEVDLAPYAGQNVMLSLVVDSLGSAYYDWAVWANPKIE